jgi:phosphopantothenoylcysteine decarboxylase/phosphopantothenate--cysteine ligase
MSKTPHILLGVTGSIAAYKAAELVRILKKREWDVSVIMTQAATEFITPLTFHTLSQNPVSLEMFKPVEDWQPDHIALSDRADALLIAPCTANVIAKIAHGIADDLLSCTALATTTPIVIAPAMNEKMWKNPATQTNVELLTSRGIHMVGVGTGDLACGYQGEGRLAELDTIIAALDTALKSNSREN